jgi:hypothetical protein
MNNLVSAVAVVALLVAVQVPSAAEDSGAAPFLKHGKDYVLRFAGQSPFTQRKGIPFDPNYKVPAKSGRITSASVTYSINVFTIVEVSSGPWVRVEHPESIEDAFKWNQKRFAVAALTPTTIARLESTEEGQAELARLQKQAAVEIETDTTWININHVVAITEPPAEPQKYKLEMRVESGD